MGFALRHLLEKPWMAEAGAEVHDGRGMVAIATEMLGLRVFLIVVTILFSLLASAYAMRMGFADWRPLPEPGLLWLNTALLIASSGAFQWARLGIRRRRLEDVRLGLLAGGVLGIAFLVGQFFAWRQLGALGYFADANPANAFFYLITALHALHLGGGLIAWGRTAMRLQRGLGIERLGIGVDLCTVYWHYLLLVWLVLFGLLLLT